MRYRYVSYKYSRKVSPETTMQNLGETYGAWAVPVASAITRRAAFYYICYEYLVPPHTNYCQKLI